MKGSRQRVELGAAPDIVGLIHVALAWPLVRCERRAPLGCTDALVTLSELLRARPQVSIPRQSRGALDVEPLKAALIVHGPITPAQ